jgi:hypothetical protein
MSNQILTGNMVGESGQSTPLLKPVRFLLVVRIEEGSEIRYEAHAEYEEIVSTHQDRLAFCPKDIPHLRHTAFLIAASGGHLIQKGCGALKPPEDFVHEVLNSRWVKDLDIDTALLSGGIPNIDALAERIKLMRGGWPAFETLWNRILDRLPSREDADIDAFNQLKKRFQPAVTAMTRSAFNPA